MNTSLKQSMVICLFAYGSTFFGCHSAIWQCRTPQQEVQQERFVRIGGRVNNPGRADLESGGLTLRQGLQLAGVARLETVNTSMPSHAPAIGMRLTAQQLFDSATSLAELISSSTTGSQLSPETLKQWELVSKNDGKLRLEVDDEAPEGPARKAWDEFVNPWNETVSNKINAAKTLENAKPLSESIKPLLPKLSAFIEKIPQSPEINTAVSAVSDPVQLISVRRQSGGRVQTFLFPYSFVVNGDAGGIALEHGDFIAVVSESESPLNLREPDQGAISVAGYVKKGGDFDPFQVGKRNVGDVLDHAGKIDEIRYEMICCVLSRYSSNGDGLVTVIAPVPDGDSFARAIRVSGGDQISFTPTPLAPLIVNSFISGSARNTISDEVLRKKSSATGLQKVAQSAQQCANQIGQQTRKGFNQVLSGQVPSITRKSTGAANDPACAIPARIASR